MPRRCLAALAALAVLTLCAGCALLSFAQEAPPAFEWEVAARPTVTPLPEATPVALPQGYLAADATVRYEETADLDGDGAQERIRICWQTGLRAGMYLEIGETVAQLPPNTPWNYICTLADLDEGDGLLELAVYEVESTYFYRYVDGVIYELGALYGCLEGQRALQQPSIFPDGAGRVSVALPDGDTAWYRVENHRLVEA